MEPHAVVGTVVSGTSFTRQLIQDARGRPIYPDIHVRPPETDHDTGCLVIRLHATSTVYLQRIGLTPASRWRRIWWTLTGRDCRPSITAALAADSPMSSMDCPPVPALVTPETQLTLTYRLPWVLPTSIYRRAPTRLWIRANDRRYLSEAFTIT